MDEAKIEVVGCFDDVAICNGEVVDGVGVLGELKDVCAIPSDQGVLASAAFEPVALGVQASMRLLAVS